MDYNNLVHNRTLRFPQALQAPVRRCAHIGRLLLAVTAHHFGERFAWSWFLFIQNDEKSTALLSGCLCLKRRSSAKKDAQADSCLDSHRHNKRTAHSSHNAADSREYVLDDPVQNGSRPATLA